jgi:hypothetical protein
MVTCGSGLCSVFTVHIYGDLAVTLGLKMTGARDTLCGQNDLEKRYYLQELAFTCCVV